MQQDVSRKKPQSPLVFTNKNGKSRAYGPSLRLWRAVNHPRLELRYRTGDAAGLLDYRIILDGKKPLLHGEIVETAQADSLIDDFQQKLLRVPPIRASLAAGNLRPGKTRRMQHDFAPSHTVKRTILDLRRTGARYAAYP